MYKYMRMLMDAADHVGKVESVNMGSWGKDETRITIEGHNGEDHFELTLTMPRKGGKNGD